MNLHSPRSRFVSIWHYSLAFYSIVLGVFLIFTAGCATTFVPVATDEAAVSYQGKGLTVAKEGLALSVIPRPNPTGLGSGYTTFELVVENTTDEKLRFMVGDAVLFSSRGEQFEAMPPESLPAVVVSQSYEPVFAWHTYRGRHGYYRQGGIVHVPVTRVQSTHARERGLRFGDRDIYPGALIRGNLYFPCGTSNLYSMRLLITRLVPDGNRDVTRERLDNGDEVIRTPVRETPYEFEFDLRRD